MVIFAPSANHGIVTIWEPGRLNNKTPLFLLIFIFLAPARDSNPAHPVLSYGALLTLTEPYLT